MGRDYVRRGAFVRGLWCDVDDAIALSTRFPVFKLPGLSTLAASIVTYTCFFVRIATVIKVIYFASGWKNWYKFTSMFGLRTPSKSKTTTVMAI